MITICSVEEGRGNFLVEYNRKVDEKIGHVDQITARLFEQIDVNHDYKIRLIVFVYVCVFVPVNHVCNLVDV
jgi:hypothetical protein